MCAYKPYTVKHIPCNIIHDICESMSVSAKMLIKPSHMGQYDQQKRAQDNTFY